MTMETSIPHRLQNCCGYSLPCSSGRLQGLKVTRSLSLWDGERGVLPRVCGTGYLDCALKAAGLTVFKQFPEFTLAQDFRTQLLRDCSWNSKHTGDFLARLALCGFANKTMAMGESFLALPHFICILVKFLASFLLLSCHLHLF